VEEALTVIEAAVGHTCIWPIVGEGLATALPSEK
jgi:hypothetical protein